jgi:16S rRNA (guanine(966)-N(2))-methyltransferase RsmD
VPDAGRVITGVAGGLRLEAPGKGTRPLSGKVKQALFSMLESAHPNAWQGSTLDLFAGSGAAGIEALSRGATNVVLVEHDGRAARVIGTNLDRTHLSRRGRIVRGDVGTFLAAGAGGIGEAPFSVAILDPPYVQTADLTEALEQLGDKALAWLEPDAVVVAKHFWKDVPADRIGTLERLRDRRFGETALSVYRRKPDLVAEGGP